MAKRTTEMSSSGYLSQKLRSHSVSKRWGTGILLVQKVYGFWVKRITCLHTDLTRNHNLLVQNLDSVPDWLSQGITTLIPKNDKTDQATNYRPITCLSVY